MSEQTPPSDYLSVRMLAPTSKPYEGRAVSVTTTNKVGQFDILVGHANFFSLLLPSDVVINTGAQKLTFAISGGLIKVKTNVVTLFVNIDGGSTE